MVCVRMKSELVYELEILGSILALHHKYCMKTSLGFIFSPINKEIRPTDRATYLPIQSSQFYGHFLDLLTWKCICISLVQLSHCTDKKTEV